MPDHSQSADPIAGPFDTQLFAQLYHELHRLAQRAIRRSAGPVTLSATTLLHEAWLDLAHRNDLRFPDRAHFLAYASRAMRGLVIDYTRNRCAVKRGAEFEFTAVPEDVAEESPACAELERLSAAIDELAVSHPRLAQVVDLKYFGGFSFNDIAGLWGVSERTVQRDWEKARMFLHRVLSQSSPSI